jgi:hypothetical protein
MLKPLSARSLADLANGEGELVINRAIKTAVADLDDRGKEDGKERTVTIVVTMAIAQGMFVANVAATPKLPPHRSNATELKPKYNPADGTLDLLFQDMNAENADQPTFREMDVEGGEVAGDDQPPI